MLNPNRKKVLFLITKSNWGGAQRYVYDLATRLNKEQFEVVVALGGSGELAQMLEHAGIRVIQLKTLVRDISLKREWQFVMELSRILRNERPDILHVNSSKAGGVGTFLGRLHRVPKVIFTAHGWAFNEDRPGWQKIIIYFLHWLTVMFSHRTIAVSKALLAQLNLPGIEKKAKVLYLGRTIGAMYDKTEARENILNIVKLSEKSTPGELWLGSIAELHPIKRQLVLLSSVKQLLDAGHKFKFFLIGEGTERTKLENFILENKLGQNVFLVGAINEAARFLKAFDIFALTSKSEAYGYVAHEAGLAGRAVVVTNAGGLPEIVDDNETGLIVPVDDTEAITRALQRLIDDPTLRSKFGQALQEKMQTRSLTKMVEATEALYTLN
ncbi:MAG: glycosyltransferase [Candidatus Paceibacterota bacterium]